MDDPRKEDLPEIVVKFADGTEIKSIDYGRSEDNWEDFIIVDKDTNKTYCFKNISFDNIKYNYEPSDVISTREETLKYTIS